MRCARTAPTICWTSSGSAWSRPASSARAFAARSSSRPARGLAPSSTRGVLARAREQRDDVVAQRLGRPHAGRRVLRGEQLGGVGDRLERRDAVAGLVRGEHPGLAAGVGVAERQPHHEAVDLRLGQRVGALVLDRVLRREHEERARELVRVDVDGHAPLLHALEQARLRLRRRAVDLVDEHDVREDRAGPELEAALALVEDVRADDVGGQQVGGALDARELEVQRARERACERRLADARQVLDEHVAAGEHGDDEVLDDVVAHLGGARDVRRDAPRQRAGRLDLGVGEPLGPGAFHQWPSVDGH